MVFHSFYLCFSSRWIPGNTDFVTCNGITNKPIFSLLFLKQRYWKSAKCNLSTKIYIALLWQPQIIRSLQIAVGRSPKISPKPQPGTSLLSQIIFYQYFQVFLFTWLLSHWILKIKTILMMLLVLFLHCCTTLSFRPYKGLIGWIKAYTY